MELSRTFDADLRIDGEPVAFFGRWEPSAQDVMLFSEFESWARRIGARRVYGPVESSTLGVYRLQVSDFESKDTFPGEPRNSAELPERLHSLGYSVAQTYVTYWTKPTSKLRAWIKETATDQLSSHYRLCEVTPEYWAARREDLRLAVNDMFAGNFAFSPIDEGTFESSIGRFLGAICPQSSFVVEHASGEIAGLCACFPGADGTLCVKTLGIVSRFRTRGVSLVALIREIFTKAAIAPGPSGVIYGRIALCLMREEDFPSLLLKSVVEHERRYALFAKEL